MSKYCNFIVCSPFLKLLPAPIFHQYRKNFGDCSHHRLYEKLEDLKPRLRWEQSGRFGHISYADLYLPKAFENLAVFVQPKIW